MRRMNRGTNQIYFFLLFAVGALFPLLAEWTLGLFASTGECDTRLDLE
ncbi:hypothetical protein SAMN04487904_103122 [Actinopolyspora lacussalsi subsp. righensis]|uniref:Uncharacterized protein n=1 Tax=Actinopolyspora righensis TaxID=995060 RepID=A0A1I6YRY7_9ACTN|nr:hypothetical protein [Actinopolyspora righensis]SFT53001.1 hypothetical protein SAMN04487904_103122 [Actinopolyspora righensis]